MRKLLITPWFGPLPNWMSAYWANTDRLIDHGYDFLTVTDLDEFSDRVKNTLGVDCPIRPGTGKIWDYRPAFGVLFADELAGYDFWGHTDFDCVYGRVEKWVTDGFLHSVDIHSNHSSYVCGPWTLYRNTDTVNTLFAKHPDWETILSEPEPFGWAETGFTNLIDSSGIRVAYTYWQTRNLDDFSTVRLDPTGELTEAGQPVMMAHFRRTKVYPEGCLL